MALASHYDDSYRRDSDRSAPPPSFRHVNDTDRRLRIFLLLAVLAVTANVLMVVSGAIQYPVF